MQTPEEVAREALGNIAAPLRRIFRGSEHAEWLDALDVLIAQEVEQLTDLIRARDAEVRADERAKVLAGFTEVYALVWDGEPSMSGEPHRVSTGADLSGPDARRALATVGRRKPNARVERRLVSPWEPTP